MLALPGTAPVAELGAMGVKRISVGSGFSNVAAGALADAGRELLEQGTYDFWGTAADRHGRDPPVLELTQVQYWAK